MRLWNNKVIASSIFYRHGDKEWPRRVKTKSDWGDVESSGLGNQSYQGSVRSCCPGMANPKHKHSLIPLGWYPRQTLLIYSYALFSQATAHQSESAQVKASESFPRIPLLLHSLLLTVTWFVDDKHFYASTRIKEWPWMRDGLLQAVSFFFHLSSGCYLTML